MPLLPRKSIASLKECPHGGIDLEECRALGVNPGDLLDFSVSTNPFMPPPGIRTTISSSGFQRYPDSGSVLLRRKLAQKLGVEPENIVAGNGTTELIRLISMIYLKSTDTALIVEPTYGEYETACRFTGARFIKYLAQERTGFIPDITALTDAIIRKRPRVLFLCNPNNPTGQYLPRRNIERILEALGDRLLVLDEAYVPFVEESWDSLSLLSNKNTIILRSMTKDYGIPGLRLGYALAPLDIAGTLRIFLPPWNVNTIAQEAGLALLENDEYLRESLAKTREAGCLLAEELTGAGFQVLPSDTHFFLVKVGNGREVRLSLLHRNILVRDCASFGLPGYIRISTRSLPECRKLVAALEEILKKGENGFLEMPAKHI